MCAFLNKYLFICQSWARHEAWHPVEAAATDFQVHSAAWQLPQPVSLSLVLVWSRRHPLIVIHPRQLPLLLLLGWSPGPLSRICHPCRVPLAKTNSVAILRNSQHLVKGKFPTCRLVLSTTCIILYRLPVGSLSSAHYMDGRLSANHRSKKRSRRNLKTLKTC